MADDIQTTINVLAETGSATSNLGRLDQAFRKFFENTGKTPDETKAFLKLAKDAETGAVAIESLDRETQELLRTYQNLRAVARARDTLELIPHARIRDEISKVRAAYETLRKSGKLTGDELAQASKRAEQEIAQLNARLKDTGENLNTTGEKTGFFASALKRLAGVFAAREVVRLADSTEQLKETLTVLTGSTEQATEEFKFIRAEADRMGIAFNQAADSYVQLTTAARGTALEGQKTRDIFSAVAGAMARIGKSDQVEAALFAITKAMADGTITSREFFGQLSKFLPNALQIVAKELGVTTDALQIMLDRGEIAVNDFLPTFASALDKTFGNQNKERIDGIGSAMNRMVNQLTRIGETVANLEVLQIAFNALATTVNIVASAVNFLSIGLVTLTQYTQAAAVALGEFFRALSRGDFQGFSDRVAKAFSAARDEIDKTTDRILATDENLRNLAGVEKNANDATAAAIERKTQAIKESAAAEKSAAQATAAAFSSLSNGLKESITLFERSRDSADDLKKIFSTLFNESAFTAGAAGLTKVDAVLTRLMSTTGALSAEVRDGLGAALTGLTNEQLRDFQDRAEAAFAAGTIGMESVSAIADGALSASLKKLGVNTEIAFDGITKASKDAIENFTILAKSGQFNADVISKAFRAALEKLDTPLAVNRFIEAIKTLGKEGKLSIQQVDEQIVQANARLADLSLATQENAAAFKTLGIESAAALQAAADKARAAFELIQQSKAPIEDIQRAFLAYAKAALAAAEASKSPVDGLLRAQAAALGLRDEFAKLEGESRKLTASFDAVAKAQDAAIKSAESHTRAVEAEGRAAIAAAQAELEKARQRNNAIEITRATIAVAETEAAVAAKVAAAKRDEAAASAERVVQLEREAAADGELTKAELEVLDAIKQVAAAKEQEAEAAQAAADAKAIEAENTRKVTEAEQGVSISLEAANALQRERIDLVRQYGEAAGDVFDNIIEGIETAARGQDGLIALTGEMLEAMRRTAAEAGDEILGLTKKLNDAQAPTEELTDRAERTLETYKDLGDEALAGLRKALEDARQRTLALREAAADTLRDLQDQLDQIKGNEEAVAKREFERKKAELEAQLKEAIKAGDVQAQKDLQEALRLLEQIRVEREKQRAADAKAEAERKKAEEKRRREEAGDADQAPDAGEPPGRRRFGDGAQRPGTPPPAREVTLNLTFQLEGDLSEQNVREKIVPILRKVGREVA